MRITKCFGSYNQRRYGRPWIAKITDWPMGGHPEVMWGSFLGNSSSGEAGEAEIEAEPGDVIKWGQKDHRGGNTEVYWGVVKSDGSLETVDAQTARQAWSSKKAEVSKFSAFSDSELIEELVRRGFSVIK